MLSNTANANGYQTLTWGDPVAGSGLLISDDFTMADNQPSPTVS